jgi:hypothetical protein
VVGCRGEFGHVLYIIWEWSVERSTIDVSSREKWFRITQFKVASLGIGNNAGPDICFNNKTINPSLFKAINP